jgi:hypothetical protein
VIIKPPRDRHIEYGIARFGYSTDFKGGRPIQSIEAKRPNDAQVRIGWLRLIGAAT